MDAAKDYLGPGSPLAAALDGFRPRPQQLEMAAAVEEALAEGRHLVVEAGTGVGKSFAYLVPALLHLAGGGGPVLVATRTIALQEQLVGRDIPFLLRALGVSGITVALAKGRGNYVCRRRLEMAHQGGAGLFDEPAKPKQIERIRNWARRSVDGSRADLAFRPLPEVWDLVRAESGNCLHQRCPFYEPCAYQRSRREMYSANLIVANHALVFSDLVLREAGVSFLPDYDCLVLDEAHGIEDGAAEYFGAGVNALGIVRLLGRFSRPQRASGLFERVEASVELYLLLEEVRAAAKQLFESVGHFRGDRSERRLREAGAFSDPFNAPAGRLVAALRGEHSSISDPGLALEWKKRTDRLEETRDAVSLIRGLLEPDLVYWAEAAPRRRSNLRAAPVEVAPVLRRALFGKVKSVVMTSATLSVQGSFDHFRHRVGLDEPAERALGSPFDFRRQCRLLLFPEMPDPRTPEYGDAVVERVRELVLQSGGGSFVLFTSYRALVSAHDALEAELKAAGLKVMRQGADLRHSDIIEAFLERRDCVLFGTDTFWQGVDVKGDHLRLVILTRLPFSVPDHPLQEARVEHIEDTGGDGFREFSLPQAVLKLRQGFGRLIRTQEDRGAVAILDPRIKTKWYGSAFLRSLPDGVVEER